MEKKRDMDQDPILIVTTTSDPMMMAEFVDPTDIICLNEYTFHTTDEAFVLELEVDMAQRGWQGSPVIVSQGHAVNGTHRILAARRAGIDIFVLDLEDLITDFTQVLEDVMILTDLDFPQAVTLIARLVLPQHWGLDLDLFGTDPWEYVESGEIVVVV